MHVLLTLWDTLVATISDVLPIAAILFGFQLLVLRRPIPNLSKVLIGFFYVLLGLAFFLEGLELALFPVGKLMAQQLTDPAFLAGVDGTVDALHLHWSDYHWVYLFGLAIGFATTIAEPALLAVAIKANQVSGGAIGIWGLVWIGRGLATLLLQSDQIRVGMAGNLAGYTFIDRNGNLVTGAQVDYNGQPAGYTLDPQEDITYVSKHDNQTLYDINAYKTPVTTSMADRVRLQAVVDSFDGAELHAETV